MRLVMISMLALGMAAPAFAQTHQDGDHAKTTDPNRVICRSEEVIGSRLQTEKTCHTAAEWEQLSQEQRRTVERIQTAPQPHS